MLPSRVLNMWPQILPVLLNQHFTTDGIYSLNSTYQSQEPPSTALSDNEPALSWSEKDEPLSPTSTMLSLFGILLNSIWPVLITRLDYKQPFGCVLTGPAVAPKWKLYFVATGTPDDLCLR